MILKPLRKDLVEFIKKHRLTKKWLKVKKLFESNKNHPSLNTELLNPKWRGIYSLRIDKRYRALFFIISAEEAEIFLLQPIVVDC